MTFLIASLAGLAIGLISSSPLYTMKIGTMMHEATRSGTPTRAARATRRALVVAQMAGSFMLVTGASLLWVSLGNLLALDLGFRTENVITGAVTLPTSRYASDDAARSFVNRSLDSSRQLPDVVAAGATTVVPLGGGIQTGVVIAEGYTPRLGEPPVSAVRSFVTPGYFEAVGTPLVRGRYFEEQDGVPESRAIVIDEQLARRFWPDGDAVGQRMFSPSSPTQFRVDAKTPWLTVVGIVSVARLTGSSPADNANGTTGTIYLPYAPTAPRNIG